MDFELQSDFKPMGDQPEAIKDIVTSINNDEKFQTLLGVTGSGKTFTMANIIREVKKPTLILAHNKTLAAQLYSEFKEFFPNNAVEYFVSYYDYYQPEAYVASSDTYIEKDASINDEIDKLRHSATASILERDDVIVVSSVSCIYGIGDPDDYKKLMLSLRPGMEMDRDELIRKLVSIQYERNDINFIRGTFRVRGDILELFPASNDERAIRIEFFGDEIDRIVEIDYVTGKILGTRNYVAIFPASHYVTTPEKVAHAVEAIENELSQRVKYFKEHDKLLEAQRIEQRTKYDSVKISIDLHRDGQSIKTTQDKKELHDKYTTKINGETVSKFFLVVGQRNKNVGELKRQAEEITALAQKKYPGLVCPVVVKPYGRFNQYMADNGLLIEIGNNATSTKESQGTCKYLAEILDEYYSDIKK